MRRIPARSLVLLLCLGSMSMATARSGSEAPVEIWVETAPTHGLPGLDETIYRLPGSTWIQVEAEDSPTVARLDLEGRRIVAVTKHTLVANELGQHLLWTPPGPTRLWALSGATRVWMLERAWLGRAIDEARMEPGLPWMQRARDREARWRQRRTPIVGPALLDVEVTAELRGLEAFLPFDLILRDEAGRELRRTPTTVWIPREGEPGPRRIRFELRAGEAVADLETLGIDARVSVRVHAHKSRLGSPSLSLNPLPTPGVSADAAEPSGAQPEPDPGSVDALIAMDHRALVDWVYAQTRTLQPGTRPVLSALEDLARSDRAPVARRSLARELLQDHWRDATSWQGAGRARDGVREVAYLAGSRTFETALDRLGARRFLPSSIDFEMRPDERGWQVVRWMLMNLSDETQVVGLDLDGEALRIIGKPGVTTFRIAMAPGPHRFEADLGPKVYLASNLPGEETGEGPWGSERPYIRRNTVRGVDAGGVVEFRFPVGYRHLRVEAWWEGEEPRTLEVQSRDGTRDITLNPREQRPLGRLGDRDLGEFAYGRAGISFFNEVRAVSVRVPPRSSGALWLRVLARGPGPRPLAVEAVEAPEQTADHEAAEPTAVDDPEEPTASDTAVDPEGLGKASEAQEAPDAPGTAAWDPDGCTQGCSTIETLTRSLANSSDPQEQTELLLQRAEALLDIDRVSWAIGDVERAQALTQPSWDIDQRIWDLEEVIHDIRSERHLQVVADRSFLVLDPVAAIGPGVRGPLRVLAPDDSARAVAEGRWEEALTTSPHKLALRIALARQAWEQAQDRPEAALETLLLTYQILGEVELREARSLYRRSRLLTRWDMQGLAASAGDRTRLQVPDLPGDDADRRALVSAGLGDPDVMLASGQRWVLSLPELPSEGIGIRLRCMDLAGPSPEPCRIETTVDGETQQHVLEADSWHEIRWPSALTPAVTVRMQRGGRERWLALYVELGDTEFPGVVREHHVAWPGAPVLHHIEAPTLLRLRVVPRAGDGTVRARLLDGDGHEVASWSWQDPQPMAFSDQGVGYGPAVVSEHILEADANGRLSFEAEGGAVALRLSWRRPQLLRLPEVGPSQGRLSEGALQNAVQRTIDSDLPRSRFPPREGRLVASTGLRLLSDLDGDALVQPGQWTWLGAGHRVRLQDTRVYLAAGAEQRIHFLGSTSTAADLSVRWEPTGLPIRVRGHLHGVVQRWEGLTRAGWNGSAAASLRLVPAHFLVLEPLLGLRAAGTPLMGAPGWDPELRSLWRFQHPFGWYARLRALFLPWSNAGFLVALRARSNANFLGLDRVGADLEFRWASEPVTLAASWRPSWRFADQDRQPGSQHHALAVRAEADFGPRGWWIRPVAELRWIPTARAYELELELRVEPGRGGSRHLAPSLRRFAGLRRVAEQRTEQGW
jgi:hypothetical protein